MTTPSDHDPRALRHHHPPHAACLRAQRHAHADLARALRDDVRQHAVETDRAKDQRERRRDAERQHRERQLHHRRPRETGHRVHAVHRRTRRDLAHERADFRRDRPPRDAVFTTYAGDEMIQLIRLRPDEREVDQRRRASSRKLSCITSSTTPTTVSHVVEALRLQTLADRILARPQLDRPPTG